MGGGAETPSVFGGGGGRGWGDGTIGTHPLAGHAPGGERQRGQGRGGGGRVPRAGDRGPRVGAGLDLAPPSSPSPAPLRRGGGGGRRGCIRVGCLGWGWGRGGRGWGPALTLPGLRPSLSGSLGRALSDCVRRLPGPGGSGSSGATIERNLRGGGHTPESSRGGRPPPPEPPPAKSLPKPPEITPKGWGRGLEVTATPPPQPNCPQNSLE